VGQAIVVAQVTRMLRNALAREVGRRRADLHRIRRQRSRHPFGRPELAHPHHRVELLFDHVHAAVVEVQFHRHLRIRGQVARHQRRQHAAAPGHRRADPQHTLRLRLEAFHTGFGLLHLLEHRPAAGQVIAAGIGETLAACVPLQQAHAKVRLQLLDVLADHH